MNNKLAFPRIFSLVGKLTVHYTLFTFLILLTSTVLMYWGLISSFDRRNASYLDSQVQLIGELLQKGDQEALKKEVLYEHVPAEYIRHYERVLDEGERVLLETPVMQKLVPPQLFTAESFKGNMKAQRFADGNLYVLKSAWFPLAGGGKRLVQVVLEISQVEKIRADYRHKLLAVLLVGVLLCAGAGVFIARWDLRPLREITDTARNITVSNLDERIYKESFPQELRVLATAFDGMLDRLKNSFESLSDYSANLAHELRTPISILMGEAEVALSRQRSAEEYRRVIESELEECQHLTRLIESLLFLARFDRHEIELKPEEVNVCELVEGIWEYYGPLVEEHGITFDCTGDVLLRGDRELLRRAFGYLLHNAIVYNKEGGRVAVAMHYREDRSPEIRISDTGCGISPENLPRIFDRLYRNGRSKQLSPMWPGLVLPTAKAIMEIHGGTITVESELDRGTTFTLRFPPPTA
ncbi:heavy metal sensor histidine kinase [Geobacter sp. AOG1]|uniref:heavy metal sensor histidine kinase n=1 Tax=Geobacter sp. AOG1 TaxID=1566346 RepID=UPI001CC41CE9|nr:heavy metal sensor histidine kinase [Geobacter sp. AOG1]GFE59100.1 two-component sensor histidine kinase [Geobacter sp. AOG1]